MSGRNPGWKVWRKPEPTSLAEFPKRQADDADGRGMPGTAVMKSYIEAVDATGYEWPFTYSLE